MSLETYLCRRSSGIIFSLETFCLNDFNVVIGNRQQAAAFIGACGQRLRDARSQEKSTRDIRIRVTRSRSYDRDLQRQRCKKISTQRVVKNFFNLQRKMLQPTTTMALYIVVNSKVFGHFIKLQQ
jgi:hypothetical protein